MKILLVDDNRENLLALEAALEGLGQELVTASSGIEALRCLLDDDFAAILLDVRMPDMDGFETATLIRSRKRSRNTPILFLTGYKNEEHLFRGYDLGAVDFLFKPIVPEILQSKVAVFVELSRSSALLRRQAEDLQRTEARLRAVLEAAPEAMIIFDSNSRIHSVNSEAERLFGYARRELIGQSMALLSTEWPGVVQGQATEIICHTSAGRAFPAEVSLSPVGSPIGSPAGSPQEPANGDGIMVSVIRDITERRRAQQASLQATRELERQVEARTRELLLDNAERKRVEQALRESEQNLRVAIEAASLGLWSVDMRTSRMQISPLACELLGVDQAITEISLAEWKELIHADDRSQAASELDRACAGFCAYESEYRVLRRDGELRWLLARGQPFPGESDDPPRVVGVLQDVTHRKSAEEADRHRHKLESLGILAGGIAHDFNNLLTGILGNASILLDSVDENSFDKQLLTDLVNAADRAAQLTRQMLAYSGRGKFVVQPTSIPCEVREITALIRSSIPRTVNLKLDLDPDAPLVEADKSQIQQLVMNLVINAAEAIGPEGGTVRIASFHKTLAEPATGFYPCESLPPGHYVVLEVEDDGHGISQSALNRIFDPFFTTKFTGRGLGLAAVLGIVRGHRGGIAVQSRPGEGTMFRVFLPSSQYLIVDEPRTAAAQEELRGSGTVLVVDDEVIVRNLATTSLRHYGYDVVEAEDGQSGLNAFLRNPGGISVVLLDMALPDLSGAEVLKAMRATDPQVIVIASSGYSETEALERFGNDVAGFLQKPYTARQLAMKISSALKTARV